MRLHIVVSGLSFFNTFVEKRAGISVWYERSIRNRKVWGSNPAQSTTFNAKGDKSLAMTMIYLRCSPIEMKIIHLMGVPHPVLNLDFVSMLAVRESRDPTCLLL
jgi:hypothetical protein